MDLSRLGLAAATLPSRVPAKRCPVDSIGLLTACRVMWEQGGFTARIPDIPAYGEGETEDEAVRDLKEAVRGYIDAFGLDDALARLTKPTLRELDWDLAELTRD